MGTAVPFYLHPAEHPAAWDALLTGDLGVEFAVVNVSDGPGDAVDEYYHPVLSRPRAVDSSATWTSATATGPSARCCTTPRCGGSGTA